MISDRGPLDVSNVTVAQSHESIVAMAALIGVKEMKDNTRYLQDERMREIWNVTLSSLIVNLLRASLPVPVSGKHDCAISTLVQ